MVMRIIRHKCALLPRITQKAGLMDDSSQNPLQPHTNVNAHVNRLHLHSFHNNRAHLTILSLEYFRGQVISQFIAKLVQRFLEWRILEHVFFAVYFGHLVS